MLSVPGTYVFTIQTETRQAIYWNQSCQKEECATMDDSVQNDMEHLPRVKLKSERYFRSQYTTKYDSVKIYFLLLLLCATMYDPVQNDMEHLPRVETKSERYFRSQYTTEYDSVETDLLLLGQIGLLLLVVIGLLLLVVIGLLLLVVICLLLFFLTDLLILGQHDMEHLPRVKPKSERYFRLRSTTKYDYVEIGLLLLVLICLLVLDQTDLLILVVIEKNLKQLEELIWQLEELIWQLEESTWQLEESTWQLEESTWQLEESTWQLEESTWQEGTRRLVQPHKGLIAPKYKPQPQLTTSRVLYQVLIMMQLVGLCCGPTGNTDCLTTQSILLGSQGIIRCRLFEDSTRFYWYDTNNEGGDTLLIKLENGRVRGTGYMSDEFNIDSDGSLIINSVTVQHERVFHFKSVNSNLIPSTKDITVIVYVEPNEPIPVITECLGKPDCIIKGNLDGVISCVHHNTRPAATISWFMRDGTHDIPLNSTTSQTLSADLITFSVTSEMAIGEIPLLGNMQSLVLLVCKSHNPYSVVQESDSKVLLDLSQNDPFEKQPDLPGDPVYAIQNQDLVIECPLTIAEDSIVMWMAKSLETKNSGYLIYSAYSVFPSVDTDEQFSLDKSGDLVISQVGLHHEGLYACVKSTGNTTKSFLQRVEVIVQPTPSTVLVEGCKLFQPCSFHITETRTITCKVNGVHPKVELMINSCSTNLAVIKTEVSTYEDEGLFYTSIRGDVIVVDDSCQENGTIICQAVGPAANVFKSDVHITISSHREKCPQTSAAPFPTDKAVQTSPAHLTILTIVVAILCIAFIIAIIAFIIKYCAKRNWHSHMHAVPVMEMSNV